VAARDRPREGAFLREALELAAVEAVVATATAEALMQLRRNLRLQEAMLADGDMGGFYAADAAMHELLLGLTGYRRLAALSRTAWVHVDRARRLLLPTPGRLSETLAEHRLIVEAIASRDAAAARDATRAHLRQLVARIEPLVAERPELFD